MTRYYRKKYIRFRGRRIQRDKAASTAGFIVKALLLMYVVDRMLVAIVPVVDEQWNETTGACNTGETCYFHNAVTFLESIMPVFGIIIIAMPIYNLFKGSVF